MSNNCFDKHLANAFGGGNCYTYGCNLRTRIPSPVGGLALPSCPMTVENTETLILEDEEGETFGQMYSVVLMDKK